MGILGGKPECQRKSNQKKDNEPGIMDTDLDPPNRKQFYRLTNHGFLPSPTVLTFVK